MVSGRWLLGILLIVGLAGGLINSVLYKIVPFLVWFHLQAQLLRACKGAETDPA